MIKWIAITALAGLALAQTPQPVSVQALLQEAQQSAQQARAQKIAPSPDASFWKQAIGKAEQATQADPQSVPAWKLLGTLYTETKFWSRADAAWRRYLALTTAQPDAEARPLIATTYLSLGYAAYGRGDLEAATTQFKNALQFSPNRPEAAEWLGRIALEQGDVASARDYYRQANTARPSPANRYFLAQAENMAANGQPAVQAFMAGYAQYQSGDKPGALVKFQEAAQAAPNWLEARRWVARTRLETGDTQGALASWQQVAASPQATASDRYSLRVTELSARYGAGAAKAYFDGVQAYQAGDKPQALTRFQTAAQANPQFPDAWYWLGRAAYDQRNFALAVEAYQRAVQLQPDNKDARYWLAQARKAAGQ